MGDEERSIVLGPKERERLVAEKLLDIFSALLVVPNLNFVRNGQVLVPMSDGRSLLEVTSSGIVVPDLTTPESFYTRTTPLPDRFVPTTELESFIKLLSNEGSILRLNHLGFCYQVDLREEERERLTKEAASSRWNLYEEESTDPSNDWFIVGDRANWQDPMVEYVPTKGSNDRWINYWLPHFQIDIDTNLDALSLEARLKDKFGSKIIPVRFKFMEDIYGIRARLGSVAGVNINLDLGTTGRITQFQRETLLKPVRPQAI